MVDRFLISRRAAMALAVVFLAMCAIQGCASPKPAPEGFQNVVLDGQTFTLELVADEATRTKGLGDRTEIAPHGGMLFSFPNARIRQFVMRDCLIDIDIIFLDAAGRIVAMHAMHVEESRKPTETAYQYESRLKKYSSRYAAQFAIEIQGGLLETMPLKEGDKINLDLEYLKSVTK